MDFAFISVKAMRKILSYTLTRTASSLSANSSAWALKTNFCAAVAPCGHCNSGLCAMFANIIFIGFGGCY